MRRLLILFTFLFSHISVPAVQAQADDSGPLPAQRFVSQPDTDHFGADLQALFDTSLKSCQRACATQSACVGFVYNLKSDACFPKSALRDPSSFVGALTVRKLSVDEGLAARAAERASRLTLPGGVDVASARDLAVEIGTRYQLSGRDLDTLVEGAQQFFVGNNAEMAVRWMGEAVALSDAADLWGEYARYMRALPTDGGSETRRLELTRSPPCGLQVPCTRVALEPSGASSVNRTRRRRESGRVTRRDATRPDLRYTCEFDLWWNVQNSIFRTTRGYTRRQLPPPRST